jgi:hypothetical protein
MPHPDVHMCSYTPLACTRTNTRQCTGHLKSLPCTAASRPVFKTCLMTFAWALGLAWEIGSTTSAGHCDLSHIIWCSRQVHRKGSTRAFPPHHPLIPVDYQFTGTLPAFVKHEPVCQLPAVVKLHLATKLLGHQLDAPTQTPATGQRMNYTT